MAELKNWGDGTKRAMNGLMIIWIVGGVLSLLFVLALTVSILSL